MITLAKETFEQQYQSRLFSFATCACLITYFGILVIPFVLVFASDNFWVMIAQEEHQLNITYSGSYFVQVTRNITTEVFTNMKYLDQLQQDIQITNSLNGGQIEFISFDKNSDGLSDQMNFDISLSGAANNVRQIIVLLPIDCSVPSLNFNFKTYLYFQEMETIGDQGISQMQIIGNVELYQQEPIPYSNFQQTDYQNISVSFDNAASWLDQMVIQTITSKYQVRPQYQVRKLRGNQQKSTRISIELVMDQQQYLRKWISLLATLKLGWLQYMSVFIFVWVIGRELLLFSFKFRLLGSMKSRHLEEKIR